MNGDREGCGRRVSLARSSSGRTSNSTSRSSSTQAPTFSRLHSRPSLENPRPLERRGRRECRALRRTRSLACEMKKHTSKSTTGSPVAPAFPARRFYGFLRALLGDRALLPPSQATMQNIVARLISASGYQDHTTSPSAASPLVSWRYRVHRIPCPTFVTTAKRPS
jgi:hypothetical protein